MNLDKKYACFFIVAVLTTIKSFSQANIDSLKNILATSKDEKVLAYAYNDYAFQFYFSKPDSAIFYAKKALEIAQKIQEKTQIYGAYNVMGLAYQIKGNFQLSLDYHNKQFEYIDDDNVSDKARLYHNIGLTYRTMKNNSGALDAELKAVALLKEGNDSLALGAVYLSIANIYRDLGDFAPAEEYILDAIDIYNNIKDFGIHNAKSLLGNCYGGYGNLLQIRGELDKAIENHNKAVQLYEEGGDEYNKAVSYENLGDDYAKQGNRKEAIRHYRIAKEIFNRINSGTDVGIEFFNISTVLNSAGQHTQAHEYADSAIALLKESEAHYYLMDVYELKYEIYDDENRSDLALAFYKKFNALKDSLNIESQRAEVLRLKEEFETTQKEQQIKLLQIENALGDKEKERQIIFRNIAIAVIGLLILMGFLIWNRNRIKQQVKQLQMRNNIALDLHDEVGSSLSSIKMLSEIASLQNENKGQLDEILKKINSNAKETAEKMHDIIWMINPKHDQLENILERMEKFLFEMCSPKGIRFEFKKDIKEILKLNMQQRKDLLLIFKEAVNNAVKYANAKKITAEIIHANHHIQLTIQDDGKGFDSNVIQPGNGLDNMKVRTTELKGSIQIESKPGAGTNISVRIPL
ncbi:MAG: tetratricopeptide repeat protein [Chitinophagales bacterium]